MEEKNKDVSQENQESKKRKRFWIFLFLGLVIFCGLIYALWRYLQSPAIGDIRMTVVTNTTDVQNKEKQYTGEYLSFSYPDVYTEKSHTVPSTGPIKESIFLSASDTGGEKIAIVVEERQNGNFDESPGFQIRLNKPKEYDSVTTSMSGYKGVLFKKNAVVFERTFYLHDGDFVVSVSSTSPLSADSLDQDLSALIDSIHFLKE